MKPNKRFLTALALSATVGFCLQPGWSQTSSNSSGTGTSPGTTDDLGRTPSGRGTGSGVGGAARGEASMAAALQEQTGERDRAEPPGPQIRQIPIPILIWELRIQAEAVRGAQVALAAEFHPTARRKCLAPGAVLAELEPAAVVWPAPASEARVPVWEDRVAAEPAARAAEAVAEQENNSVVVRWTLRSNLPNAAVRIT